MNEVSKRTELQYLVRRTSKKRIRPVCVTEEWMQRYLRVLREVEICSLVNPFCRQLLERVGVDWRSITATTSKSALSTVSPAVRKS